MAHDGLLPRHSHGPQALSRQDRYTTLWHPQDVKATFRPDPWLHRKNLIGLPSELD